MQLSLFLPFFSPFLQLSQPNVEKNRERSSPPPEKNTGLLQKRFRKKMKKGCRERGDRSDGESQRWTLPLDGQRAAAGKIGEGAGAEPPRLSVFVSKSPAGQVGAGRRCSALAAS